MPHSASETTGRGSRCRARCPTQTSVRPIRRRPSRRGARAASSPGLRGSRRLPAVLSVRSTSEKGLPLRPSRRRAQSPGPDRVVKSHALSSHGSSAAGRAGDARGARCARHASRPGSRHPGRAGRASDRPGARGASHPDRSRPGTGSGSAAITIDARSVRGAASPRSARLRAYPPRAVPTSRRTTPSPALNLRRGHRSIVSLARRAGRASADRGTQRRSRIASMSSHLPIFERPGIPSFLATCGHGGCRLHVGEPRAVAPAQPPALGRTQTRIDRFHVERPRALRVNVLGGVEPDREPQPVTATHGCFTDERELLNPER
jgi:hypothetical protein